MRQTPICRLARLKGHTGSMSSSSKLRWGDRSPGDVREARDRVLDAAERCLADDGYQRVTMEAIAAEAKISRATLYRYFSSRDEVLSGVVVRDSERYLERIRPRVEAEPDLGSAVLEFIRSTTQSSITLLRPASTTAPRCAMLAA